MNEQRQTRVFLAGDVMTGRGIDQVLPQPVSPELQEGWVKDARDYVRLAEAVNGPIAAPVAMDYIWGDSLAVIDAFGADYRIINLETSVTSSTDFWPGKGIHYRMHPQNIGCLPRAAIDCCSLANNHVMDYGYAGLAETLATLERTGIAVAGAGADAQTAARPAVLSVGAGPRVLVFAVALESSGVLREWAAGAGRAGVCLLADLSQASAEAFAQRIRNQSRPGDIVIVSIHWGDNWGYQVSPSQRRFAEHLVDHAAVNIVHGHSSHHPRPLQLYRDGLILYGCGDYLNDYEGIGGHEQYRPWLTLGYLATMDNADGRLSRLAMAAFRMRRFRLHNAGADERRWLRDKLTEISRPFATTVSEDREQLVVRKMAIGEGAWRSPHPAG